MLQANALLRGISIPLHRFAYTQHDADGVAIEGASLEQQCSVAWSVCFPASEISVVDPNSLAPADIPAVWISGDGLEIGLIRGRQASGFLVDVDGSSELKTLDQISAGRSLRMPVSVNEDEHRGSAKRLFTQAMWQRKRVFIEAIFATLMISVLGMMSALYTMQVYDRVVPNNSSDTLVVLTVGVLLAIALEWLMKLVRAQMVNRSAKAMDVELADVFFRQALSIRADRRPRTVGTFAAQVRQYEQVRSFMTNATLFALADGPFAFFFIAVIWMIAGPVALVPLLMIPVALFVGWVIQLPVEDLSRATIEETNKKNGLLIETIDGIESVKASAAEWKLENLWRELTIRISKNELKTQILTATSGATTQTFQQLSYVGIVAYGAMQISAGELTIGGLIACSIIAGRALTPLSQLPQYFVQWKQSKIGLDMLDAILKMEVDRPRGLKSVAPSSIEPGYRTEGFKFIYQGEIPALQVKDLSLRLSERVALLGTVGSGKSTMIKVLSGLFQASEGQVQLGGVDITQISFDYLREQIGYLPQDVRLFNGSLRDNLVLGLPSLRDDDLLRASRLTGLDTVILAHPRGLDLEISEGGKGLSIGQRQLVGLTRLLLAKPKILLLDEPTASMDAKVEDFVMRHLFEELPKETLILTATHKASVLNHVDRVLVLDRGEIVLDGPRDEILARMRRVTDQGSPQ